MNIYLFILVQYIITVRKRRANKGPGRPPISRQPPRPFVSLIHRQQGHAPAGTKHGASLCTLFKVPYQGLGTQISHPAVGQGLIHG